jgi:DNA-directed RNA polymerase specialized sigma24 family protein
VQPRELKFSTDISTSDTASNTPTIQAESGRKHMSRTFTAERFLILLRDDADRTRNLERYYVKLAYGYGVPVDDIARLSGINIAAVRTLLLEED